MVMFNTFQIEPEPYRRMSTLISISHSQARALADWLHPERPALIAIHALNTGQGSFLVDRWPGPQVLLVSINTLQSMLGDTRELDNMELSLGAGLMYCSERFLPRLHAMFAEVNTMDRVVLKLSDVGSVERSQGAVLRRLTADDASALGGMSQELQFISSTWGGPQGLARSGYGWGAFVDDRLVSVACTFLLGRETEDLGVATEPDFRGRGFAGACTRLLCQDVHQRGHVASWTTSTDNYASIRVAEKLGFKVWTHEALYVLRSPDAENR